MGLAKTNKYLGVLSRKTIAHISQYHSVQFHENGITFWRYYNVGVGVIIPLFPGLKSVRKFKWASNSKITTIETSLSSKKKKEKIEFYAH